MDISIFVVFPIYKVSKTPVKKNFLKGKTLHTRNV
jgi:hypothetical protein